MADRKSIHVTISGRVQGVWYRAWTKEQADARGVAGWVRNRADGSVEAVFSGAADAVDDLLIACHKGPMLAKVKSVDAKPCDAPETGVFETRPTA